MICILAMIVFGVMAIFSASHRPLAKEAFDCVFKKVTFRTCNTGFDQKMKGMITGKIMRKSPKVASVIHKHFEAISWVFVILFFVSIAGLIYGGYNFYLYGNCNGPQVAEEDPGFCIFDPTGTHQMNQVSTCGNTSSTYNMPSLMPPKNISGFMTFGKEDSSVTFVMFGCYSCDYTRKASGTYFEIYDEYKDRVKFVYVDFPLQKHSLSMESSKLGICVYNKDKEKFMEYSKEVFSSQDIFIYSGNQTENLDARLSNLKKLAEKYISQEEVEACLTDKDIQREIDEGIILGKASNIYGTPTFFINSESIVGPRPKKAFTLVIEDNLK